MTEQSINSIKLNIENGNVQNKYSSAALCNILKNGNINLNDTDLII